MSSCMLCLESEEVYELVSFISDIMSVRTKRFRRLDHPSGSRVRTTMFSKKSGTYSTSRNSQLKLAEHMPYKRY